MNSSDTNKKAKRFIKKEAEEYMNERFPKLSDEEFNKKVQVWVDRVENTAGVAQDFESRSGQDLRGKKVLDYGSGQGGVSISLALYGAKVKGVEVEEELVKIARKHSSFYAFGGNSPHFQKYDGKNLPFSDNKFDAVFSISVLEHTSDPVNYLSEAFRVLKSGSHMYLAFPNKLWPKETHTGLWFLSYLPRSIQDIYVDLFDKNPLEENNLHFYSYWSLKKMLKGVEENNQYKLEIRQEDGSAKSGIKYWLKKTLRFLGLTYKAFLPHVMVIIRKR